MTRKNHSRAGRRSGMVFIYTMLALVGLLGFCSLAIDFGRYETCKTQLRRAAIAAARAGASNMATSAGATTTAQNMAYANMIDASNISASNCTITIDFLDWPNTTALSAANFGSANSIRVTIRHTVPLLFGQALGLSGKDTVQSAVAEVSIQSTSPYVSAKSNPWLAGEYVPPNTPNITAIAAGVQASQPDPAWAGQQVNTDHPWQYDHAGPAGGTDANGEPYESPIQISFAVTPGAVITVSNVSGTAGNDVGQGAVADATGNESGTVYNYDDAKSGGVSEHGISDATMPLNALNGVFLTNNAPDDQTVPPPLDFTSTTAQEYRNIDPQLQQVFFIGDGQSNGEQKTITVPANATRMYLGTMDGWEWSNNVGGFNVTLTQTVITIVQ